MNAARHMRRRGWRWQVGALLAAVLGFGVWLGAQTLTVKSNLEQARANATQAKDALLRGDGEHAPHFAEIATAHAMKARDATRSLPWSIAAAVPFLGSPFQTGQQISDVVAGLAADVLRPAASVGVGMSAATLLDDNRVNVELLRSEEAQLRALALASTRLDIEAKAITEPGYLGALKAARSQLQSQAADLAGLLNNMALAARLAPTMLGADGPRTYLMAFQTNAEARGTGGLLGGFGILRFTNGEPTVDMLAPNTELSTASAAIDLGPEFTENYGWANAYTDFRNSNLSSHFPYAAQIWKAMWESQSGIAVDGVIALDPVALGYILDASGPVTLPGGEVVTADNVVELTESTAYFRFPTDQNARKKYLQDIANEVVRTMTAGVKSPRTLLDALARAADERRLAIWSAVPDDQKNLEETPLAHIIPDDPAPYAEVVINNLGGNKMDYYLRREVEYVAAGCDGERRKSTVRVRLTNSANPEAGLPEYIGGQFGLAGDPALDVPDGAMVSSVRVLATTGAKLESLESDGRKLSANITVERGHPSYEVQVIIPPGQSGELRFEFSEPTSAGTPRVPVQPLIDTITPVVAVPTCTNEGHP